MTIDIRGVGPQDRSQWESLWRGYQAFYDVDLSLDTDRLWRDLLEPGADGPFCLVAVDETGDLVGLAQYLFHGTTWSAKPRCYLNDLFTAENARGKGVGRALIEALYRIADERSVSRTYWLTQTFNHNARALYDKVAHETPFIKYER